MSVDKLWDLGGIFGSDMEHAWGSGGIFGAGVDDAEEVLEELEGGPYPDGNGGSRDRPGFGNVLGAKDVVSRRKMDRARRAKMLIVERFIDELPDLRDKLRDKMISGEAMETIRNTVVDRLAPPENFSWSGARPASVRSALRYFVREVTVDAIGDAFLRAYQKDVRRAQAAVRLGALGPEDWAAAQTQKILEAPASAVDAFSKRVGHIGARFKRIAAAAFGPMEDAS